MAHNQTLRVQDEMELTARMDENTTKLLSDRLYDKRRSGALLVEKTVKQLMAQGTPEATDQISKIIDQLCQDFAYAVHQPNARNGGSIGLAACAIALGTTNIARYLDRIIPPVLACFLDQAAQVRYYACEALYNISKVAKGEILVYFNDIFDVLCRLYADSENSVKNGADLFNRLTKDIVSEKAAAYVSVIPRTDAPDLSEAESSAYDDKSGYYIQATPAQDATAFLLPKFVPLLKERLFTNNPYTRLFLVDWIMLLDSVPDLELVSYLPSFMGGLIVFLTDSRKDVRLQTNKCLNMFLEEIERIVEVKKVVDREKQLRREKLDLMNKSQASKASDASGTNDDASDDEDFDSIADLYYDESNVGLYIPLQDIQLNFAEIIRILVANLDSKNEEVQLVVLNWLETLLNVTPTSFIEMICELLETLITILSGETKKLILERATVINHKLMDLILLYLDTGNDSNTDVYAALISTVTNSLLTVDEATKLLLLDWLIMLHKKSSKLFLPSSTSKTFQILLKGLCGESTNAIEKDLALISAISQSASDERFNNLMLDLISLFKNDKKLLENKGNFIIRKLCVNLNAERVYKSLALALYEMDLDNKSLLGFISIMIQILNSNLITAPELASLRNKLRNINNKDDWVLFSDLFKSWSYNAPACLSLCLLSMNYELAYNLLKIFVEFEITINLLIQLDILVQLLESPVFVKLRLQLLEPDKYPYLLKCLYGILMLLPQSNAFNVLQNRLNSINGFIGDANNVPKTNLAPGKKQKYNDLTKIFREMQEKHENHRLTMPATPMKKDRIAPIKSFAKNNPSVSVDNFDAQASHSRSVSVKEDFNRTFSNLKLDEHSTPKKQIISSDLDD